jgi:hypothetical protein
VDDLLRRLRRSASAADAAVGGHWAEGPGARAAAAVEELARAVPAGEAGADELRAGLLAVASGLEHLAGACASAREARAAEDAPTPAETPGARVRRRG